jgi:hypothetical protein
MSGHVVFISDVVTLGSIGVIVIGVGGREGV